MTVKLDCPRAKYGAGMIIYCQKDGEPCAHQYYKPCKGWCALSPGARRCPIRKEHDDGQADQSGRD